MSNFRQKALELIRGGYDLHIHSIPSHVQRTQDDLEVIRTAAEVGMAGVVIKNHYEPTAGRAALVNRIAGCGTRIYGGVALNWPVGGLNPYAVEGALKLGGAFVWLPTRDAANCLRYGDMEGDFFRRPGVHILDEAGELQPVVFEILEIVRRYDAVLATGHISTEESLAVCRAGRRMGVKMVLTHPEWPRTFSTGQLQAEMADLGVVIEKNWMNIADGLCPVEVMMDNIRQVGPHRVFIATDRGQSNREIPAEGMLLFIETLLEHGFTDSEITQMLCDVPRALVAGK